MASRLELHALVASAPQHHLPLVVDGCHLVDGQVAVLVGVEEDEPHDTSYGVVHDETFDVLLFLEVARLVMHDGV